MKVNNTLLFVYRVCGVLFILFSGVFAGCGQRKEYKSPPGYDLTKPVKLVMPDELDEISGISYYAKDNSVFVESDEKGDIYKIPLGNVRNVRRWHFGHKHDYEDIVLNDGRFYMLSSTGDLAVLHFDSNGVLQKQDYEFPFKGNMEFEALYLADSQQLNLVCKDCKDDAKTNVSVYGFNGNSGQYNKRFVIDAAPIKKMIKEPSGRFKPSAAAIDPLTGELFILSSISKVLVVADKTGNIKKTYALDPKLFKQPEGMTFTPAGDLLITNEAAGLGAGDILLFKYKKQDNK